MRISDCADLTGTTVRTIRYYHQIGLLPVPVSRGMRRDYGLDHVARLLRIRWLAEAGLSLDAIADLIAGEEDAGGTGSLHDLYATASSIDAQLAELQAQRRRIGALIAMSEEGRELTALPPALESFYDKLADATQDPGARKVLNRERRLAEMFAQRGLVPKRAEALINALTAEDMAVVVDFYTRYSRLPELDDAAATEEIDSLVAAMLDWSAANREITEGMLNVLPAWARRPRSMDALVNFSILVCSDGRQEEVIRRSVAEVVALVDTGTHTGTDTGPHTDSDTDTGADTETGAGTRSPARAATSKGNRS